jgi:hypothetical protein
MGISSDKEAELTKKASQILKDIIQNQTVPVPLPVVFSDKIPDFTALRGKTWFFGAPSVGPLLMSAENEEVWPTTIQFENYLSTFSLEDGTKIPYLPYTMIEDHGEEEGGVMLANYVDLEDGDRWFTVVKENSEFHIDQFTVSAYNFSLFQTDGQQAQAYDITYCVELDSICDITPFQGSSNVFDIVESINADIDRDRDVDDKDLIDFIINAVNGLPNADLNGDGEINSDDLRLFGAVFGSTD